MIFSLIIVSFNTKELLDQCLRSIFSQSKSSLVQVIVVDNASSDGSPDWVAQTYPQVTLIRNSQNLGFGQANDLGAKLAQGDYLFFLNSDTQLPAGFFKTLVPKLHQTKPSILGCRLNNPDGTLQPQGGYLPSLLRLALWMFNLDNLPLVRNLIKPYQLRYPSFFQTDHDLGWVGGAAMLVKRDVFEKLNGFDPQIFMYGEDVEFCYRAQRAGFKIRYFSQPAVTHHGRASGSDAGSILGEFTGLKYLYKTHKPAWQLPLVRFLLKAGSLLRFTIFAIIGRHETKVIYQKAYQLA